MEINHLPRMSPVGDVTGGSYYGVVTVVQPDNGI